MTSHTTLTPGAGAPPWQDKPIGIGLRLLLLLAGGILFVTAIASVLLSISAWGNVATGGRAWGSPLTTWIAALGFTALFVGSIAGIIASFRAISSPAAFMPSYGQVAPDALGQPFEVRFRRPTLGRALDGKGMVRFEAEQIVIDGTLAPSGWFQIGVFLVVTLIPLVLFGIGLGVIPALLLAFWLGKKKLARGISYANVRDLTAKGSKLTFRSEGETPNKITLYVSQQDGERLYRELAQRFPAVLGGWMAQST
jgi:hypothetical protein